MKIEICCGSIEDVYTAHRLNVDRIELNNALELGGLTPSLATLIEAKKATHLPLCCMVRPRPAGFIYTDKEYETMLLEAKILLDNGADGIVFGFLKKDRKIDTERTLEMVKLIKSYGKEAIFHKAFDECEDLKEALKTLIACGIDRVLTGGGKVSIEEGSRLLGELQLKYGDKIQILPGGGVREDNVQEIIRNSKCTQIHMTAKMTLQDRGEYFVVGEENFKKIKNKIDEM